jgi:hypothetical protein
MVVETSSIFAESGSIFRREWVAATNDGEAWLLDLVCYPLGARLLELAANHCGHAAFATIGLAVIR